MAWLLIVIAGLFETSFAVLLKQSHELTCWCRSNDKRHPALDGVWCLYERGEVDRHADFLLPPVKATGSRQRRTREQFDRRGLKADPPWAHRRMLLTARGPSDIHGRLRDFYAACANADMPETTRLAATIET